MKKTAALFLFGWLLVSASAADMTGTWRLDLPRRGGVTVRTFFVLEQTGGWLTGRVVLNDINLPLRHIQVGDSGASFGIDWGMTYHLTPEPDGRAVKVKIDYNWGSQEEGVAVRVPASAADLPAALPLPALRPVPANGLALTPPMGWNSWNHFGGEVDDEVVRAAARAMVRTGMAAAGYVYINIDDTWEGHRDARGNIVPNTKFPDMKALADYVHGLGLKLGIYSSPGPLTCGGYLGSYGHEAQDAKTYAAWGIDYLKYDWCSAGGIYPDSALRAVYQKMGRALRDCGRPIVYSLCEYGTGEVWKWGPEVGANLWRTTGDIQDNWKRMSEIGFDQSRLAPYAGPGHWNDPDMLEVGNGGMTPTEYRTHFSLWCLLAAPLMAGNDLEHMSAGTLAILTNREVIAVDQDTLGRQGARVARRDGVEIWTKPLHDGSLAVGVFNRAGKEQTGAFSWAEIGLKGKPATVRDLWAHRDLTPAAAGWSGLVPSHGVVMLRVK